MFKKHQYDLNRWTLLFLGGLALFFGVFLLYPVGYMVKGAFFVDGRFTLSHFVLLLASPFQREALGNSTAIALLTTGVTTLLTLPLAHLFTRFRFAGKAWLASSGSNRSAEHRTATLSRRLVFLSSTGLE